MRTTCMTCWSIVRVTRCSRNSWVTEAHLPDFTGPAQFPNQFCVADGTLDLS